MAKTVVNLSDQVSTWLSKTNTISDHLGDIATLTSGDSNVVDAINAILADPGIDSAGIRALFSATGDLTYDSATGTFTVSGVDSAQIRGLFSPGDGLDYNSATGVFSVGNDEITEAMIANDAVSSNELKNLSTLIIYDSDGTALKTIYGAGS